MHDSPAPAAAAWRNPAGWSRARHALLVLALLAAWSLHGSRLETKSPTEDEWAHLVRGIAYWSTGDTSLSYAHPPLANIITALPVAFDPAIPDITTLHGWDIADVGRVSDSYLDAYGYGNGKLQLLRARRANFAILAIGITYIYIWGCTLLGWPAGAIGAFLLGINPTILAQSQYATTDLAAGITTMIACGELTRHLSNKGTVATWLTLPIALSAAILSKHSGVLLVPIFVIITLFMCWRALGPYAKPGLRLRLRHWTIHTATSAAVVLFTINAAYRFQDTLLSVEEILDKPEPQYWISLPYEQEMLEKRTPLPHLPDGLRAPLPYTWIFGITAVGVQDRRGFPWASFMGKPTPRGHPAYFPTLILIKSPVGMLLLLAVGVTMVSRRRFRVSATTGTLGAVAIGILLFAVRSRMNMGVRHILPVITLLTMLSSIAAFRIWDRYRKIASIHAALYGVTILTLGEALASRHDYLGYFNAAIGRDLGHQISVVGEDWGQDRAEFVESATTLGLAPLYYHGQTELRMREVDYLGLKYEKLDCETIPAPGSFAVIHATRLVARPEECFPWLDGRLPLYHINNHIFVYWIPHEQQQSMIDK
jgi:4-amino-4-deoxy-L-arabinose transferase-like glycosyltransferase